MNIDPMLVILVVCGAAIVASIWRAHRMPSFDFNAFDLLMENGKVSKIAVAFMLVLGVSTWIMIDLQIKGRMTEGFLTIYTGAWIVPLVAKVVFNKQEIPSSSTLTMTSTTVEKTEGSAS